MTIDAEVERAVVSILDDLMGPIRRVCHAADAVMRRPT